MIRFFLENILKGVGISVGFFGAMVIFVILMHLLIPNRYLVDAEYRQQNRKINNNTENAMKVVTIPITPAPNRGRSAPWTFPNQFGSPTNLPKPNQQPGG